MKEILYSLLELDSIYGVISWEERMRIRFYIKGKLEDLTPSSEKIEVKILHLHLWRVYHNNTSKAVLFGFLGLFSPQKDFGDNPQ